MRACRAEVSLLLGAMALGWALVSAAAPPIREVTGVPGNPLPETTYGLTNARIAVASYSAIRRDFPETRRLSRPEIDAWLLEQAARISHGQTEQNHFNTEIPIDRNQVRRAFRPTGHGRALLFEAFSPVDATRRIGVIDGKGAGFKLPTCLGSEAHANGLMTLGEALREFAFERALHLILRHSRSGLDTVSSYAVIDAGFSVRHDDGTLSRAGIYLRKAHDRNVAEVGAASREHRSLYSSLFAHYGLDGLVIQATLGGDLFDFGGVVATGKSTQAYALPFDRWGFEREERDRAKRPDHDWDHAKSDRPWYRAHDVAERFARGEANRHDLWLYAWNLIKPLTSGLLNNKTTFPAPLKNKTSFPVPPAAAFPVPDPGARRDPRLR